jgi:hypothetical protein
MMLYECSPYPMKTSVVCNILAIISTSIQLGEKLGGGGESVALELW